MLKTVCYVLISAFMLICANVRAGTTVCIDGKHTLYLYSPSSNCEILSVDNRPPVYFKSTLKGESVSFYGGNADAFIKKYAAVKVFSEKAENTACDYYYSTKIPFYKLINGQKVNIHVSRSGDLTTIGIPFIYGSY